MAAWMEHAHAREADTVGDVRPRLRALPGEGARRGAVDAPGRGHAALLLGVFGSAILVGATLVFLVQPIAARMVLPLFGGSQSVWTTSMVFFQAVLLAGYGYAHLSARYLRRAPLVQALLLLLPLAALPIGTHLVSPPADGVPAVWLLGALALSIGAPFFIVTSASPMLQHWFSKTTHRAAADPYFLYAAGNVGSLLALVSYPVLVEPHLSLAAQARLWSAGYLLFVALSFACVGLLAWSRRITGGTAVPGPRAAADAVAAPALGWRTRTRWIFIAFVPSSLMLGATTWISTDVASAPLLWVAPLAVYLLTFIVAFSRRPVVSVRMAAFALPLLTTLVLASLLGVLDVPILAAIAVHLLTLFCVGVLAHGRLAGERPAPARLTEFYVMLSIGGVLGGVFNALLAPQIFDAVLEYPLAIVLALLLRPGRSSRRAAASGLRRFAWTLDFLLPFALFFASMAALALTASSETTPVEDGAPVAELVIGAAAVALLLFARRPVRYAVGFAALCSLLALGQSGLHVDRTFFGVLRVVEGPSQEHFLLHGTTLHGVESFAPGLVGEPLSYYSRSGPIGDVFERYQAERPFRRVAVVGLGVGTLAAYGRPGQTLEFYEIDPAVIRIASDPRLFTYLRDTKADVELVTGDGRRSLARAADGADDLLVVDAFSSDSIPVHLLTREAVALYLAKVRADGLIAFHVSNRHLELSPVVAGIARSLGLAAVERRDAVSDAEAATGKTPSHWIVLARTEERLRPLLDGDWRPLRSEAGARIWTDDFSNIVSVIDWSG